MKGEGSYFTAKRIFIASLGNRRRTGRLLGEGEKVFYTVKKKVGSAAGITTVMTRFIPTELLNNLW